MTSVSQMMDLMTFLIEKHFSKLDSFPDYYYEGSDIIEEAKLETLTSSQMASWTTVNKFAEWYNSVKMVIQFCNSATEDMPL